MEETDTPGILHRLRARYGWIDHAIRANERYNDRKGNFYAAGLAYYTIFALFPLLMVGFAIAGFILARRPDLLAEIDNRIRSSVSGDLGHQLTDVVGLAIASRTSVGVIGLIVAAWAGLGWMANLREALSQMWKQPTRPTGFVRTNLSDLAAMTCAVVVILATVALTALGDAAGMAKVLRWLGVPDFPVLGGFLRAASLVVSWLVSWLLFTWVIARLPREAISFNSSIRAGLIAAVGFELFKQVASIYLRMVLRSPAGVTFGPVVGLMVFAYLTARLVLFATAWAATSPDG
ncbi:MAG: inner membrane protein YhjD [Mycobacterium sp.]|uniref:inner membrane protein YhjD n=1 Tax=Mycobacterium sp. TaxID=1785 RepID=UPI002615AFF0|nr:inner membrane protein YhjD [Mycobacterium sp.]MDI3314761.1 inner membrane protein YhjD [Mycobacterium sp.]